MKNMFVILLLTSIAGTFCGCSDPHGANHPLSKSEPDTRPPIRFDVGKPYRLEFGRGSGWNGLDTIAIDESGHVVFHRLKSERKEDVIHHYWESANLTLSTQITGNIGLLVRDLGILDMKRAYHADVHDGTQWVFWFVQGGQEKSIYFNNHFPKAIQEFAVALNNELKSAGFEKVQWIRVPDNQARQHEEAIWNSIMNKPNKPDAGDGL